MAATSPSLLGARSATAATDGVFTLLALPPGSYTVRVTALGYRPVEFEQVLVQLGRATGLGDVHLVRAAVTLEPVRITAPRVLDPTGTAIGAALDSGEFASLPIERDYKSAMAILPHVNVSYLGDRPNSLGATGLENMYFIDGVNVTDPLRAAGGTSLPYNFIKSVEVRSGGHEAQYGRALGAIVNAITFSGTNRFEKNAFAFVTHDALTASSRSAPTLEETGAFSYDLGARVSGPVVHDRLWFSAAYNPRFSRADRRIGQSGSFADRSRADVFAGKLTWAPVTPAQVELSLFGDPSVRHEVAPCGDCGTLTVLNADPYLHLIETGGVSASLRATATPAPWLTVEGALSRASARDNYGAETARGRDEAMLLDYVAGTVSGGLDFSNETELRTDALTANATILTGRHQIVVGGELMKTTASLAATVGGARRFIRKTDSGFATHWEQNVGLFQNRAPVVYLQDTWRVGTSVIVNAGMRWSQQHLIGASGQVSQRLGAEWQPRIGFSWQPGSGASHRIRGSLGRYYQFEPLNLSTAFYVEYLFKEFSWSQDPRVAGASPYDSVNFSSREADFAGVPGPVSPERTDEITLGYERLIGSLGKLTIRGIGRHLGTAFVWGIDPASTTFFVLGTPGRGNLSFLPRFRRDYTALEVGLEGDWHTIGYRVSYVRSRNWGNYPGLFGSDYAALVNPGVNYGLATRDQASNSTGYLPNDRSHVFKLAATFHPTPRLDAGAVLTWQSGTPINEFGIGPVRPITRFPTFLAPRGSIGRTPSIADLNVRVSYAPNTLLGRNGRAILDFMHVGNLRRAVLVDQQHFFAVSQTPSSANPNYLRPIAFQPPMAARLGLEISF